MTYSIIAQQPKTGTLGVAAATGSVAVGGFVPHVRFGIGVVATQGSFTNWLYGENGLTLLREGKTATDTLDILLAEDPGHDARQLIVCDRWGNTAGHTGFENQEQKGHYCGDHFAIAGNMLASADTIEEMKEAYLSTDGKPLHERLLKAIMAAEQSGGDFRGTHSAALKVQYLDCPPLDLRVDWAESRCIEQLYALYEKTQSEAYQNFLDGVPTYQYPGKAGKTQTPKGSDS